MRLPTWFLPWIRRGGWFAFGLVVFVIAVTVVRSQSEVVTLGLMAALWIALSIGWIRALLPGTVEPRVRRVAALAATASCLQGFWYAFAVAVSGLGLDSRVWPGLTATWASLPPLLWVACLLLWPTLARARASWQYYVLDLGIVGTAAGLIVWYYSRRRGNLTDPETIFVVASSLALLVGTSVAAVRQAAPANRAAFVGLLAFGVLQFATSFGLTVVPMRDVIASTVGSAMGFLLLVIMILTTEALRDGWRWPWGGHTPEGANPVPWVAVMAIGFFVLSVVIEDQGAGAGPIVLGAMATMILLVIRQAITMGQNARLQAERAALEADARIAALVRHTSDVILIADQSLRIRFASPSAEALWTGDPNRLTGSLIHDLVDPSQRDDVDRIVAERMAQPGLSDVARWRIQGPQGDWRRIEAVVTSLFHQPSVNGIVLTLRDQTERALLEEQLNQAQKMEAIGQLAGGVAHDFNNLLTTMMGHSEVGLDILEPDHPARDDFAQIRKAAELAASLTKQLLAFSRKQIIEPKVIDVTASLDQVVKLLRRLIKEDVTTVMEVAPDVGHVRMDPSQLEQVVLNLAVNARDAMPDGGRLTIRARQQRVNTLTVDAVLPVVPGDYLVVEVSDTGIGMDRATQTRIFEPFFTTKPVGKGTGLGLASVYGIVKQNEGGLVLTSAPGQGTTFAVYLPRVPAVAPEAGTGETRRTPGGTAATVLLVEDQAALREIAERVLLREGFRVMVAADADEALMLAAGAPYPIDLVLTDVIMPGLSGPKMVAEMRKQKEIPRVLYVSGYPGDDLLSELGPADRLLRKPFTPYVLIEQVRAVLEGRTDSTVPQQ